jgi:hypothetical protein
MKHFYALLVTFCFIFSCGTLYGQTMDFTSPIGSYNNFLGPNFNNNQFYNKFISLYPHSAFNTPATPVFIHKVYLSFSAPFNDYPLRFDNFKIQIGSTNKTQWDPQDLNAWPDSILQTCLSSEFVFSIPFRFQSRNYWPFELQEPFLYDGQSNLVISIQIQDGISLTNFFDGFRGYPSNNASLIGNSLSNPSAISNIAISCGFDVMPVGSCNSSTQNFPLITSDSVFCPHQIVSIRAPNHIHGLGSKYQWQRSFNQTVWQDLPNDTGLVTFVEHDQNTYYRLRVVCGTDTGFSAVKQLHTSKSPIAGGIFTKKQHATHFRNKF